MSKKTLVAYFSASGVTAKAAKAIAEAARADLFEIAPKTAYSRADLDWTDKKSRSTLEMNDPAARPELANAVPDVSAYDTVFVGFPIWWYVEPRIVDTFLDGCDLSGKAVIPFATSGGSGIEKAEKHMREVAAGSPNWLRGRMLNGSPSKDTAAKWLKELGL